MAYRFNWRRMSPLVIGWAFAVLWLLPTFGEQFSPDSYGNLLIGRNLFHGLGFTSPAARDLFVPPVYPVVSRSFPPLYPILVGSMDRITGIGIASGVLVNLAILGGIICGIAALFRRFEVHLGLIPFWIVLITILLNESFIVEFSGARVLPLTLLLTLIATLLSVERRMPLALGVFLGLLALSRFDATAFSIFLPALLLLWRQRNFSETSKTYIAFLVVYAIWGVRNNLDFGSVFSSDNAISAISLTPGMAQLEWYIGQPVRAWNAVHEWSIQRIGYFSENVHVLINSMLPMGGLLPLIGVAALPFTRSAATDKTRLYAAIALLFTAANFASVSLTSYHDARYFSISVILIVIALTQWACDAFAKNCSSPIFVLLERRLGDALLVGLLLFSIVTVWFFRATYIQDKYKEAQNLKEIPEKFMHIIPHDSLIATGVGYAESLSYYSGYKTVATPNGPFLTPTFYDWQRHWSPDFAIMPPTYTVTPEWSGAVRASINGWNIIDLRSVKGADK